MSLLLLGLAACVSSDRSEAQPDGPRGLVRLDSVPQAGGAVVSSTGSDSVPHDARGQTTVLTRQASDFVSVQRGAAAPDSLQLPRLRRAGAPTSTPVLTRFLDDTLVAVVHADRATRREDHQGRYFLSLLNLRRGRVCLDLPLPLASGHAQFRLHGDTVEAAVSGGSNASNATAWRVRWHVIPARCPWNYVAR